MFYDKKREINGISDDVSVIIVPQKSVQLIKRLSL